MTHGWTTTKTATGFKWEVTRTEWDAALGKSITTSLRDGVLPTRARAMSIAKKWALYFRRGGVA